MATKNRKGISRRSFIKAAGFAASAFPLSQVLKNSILEAAEQKILPKKVKNISEVVAITHSKSVTESGKVDPRIAREMIDKAIVNLTGEKNFKDGWHKIFPDLKGKEVIGLKINVTNHQLPTHPEVAYAIADSLSEAGIKKNNILIWDKLDRSLKKSGYVINDGSNGYKCFGHDHNKIGFDKKVTVKIPSVSLELYLSKILTEYCDYIINVPVLKNAMNTSPGASKAGVTISLKNAFGYIPLSDLIYIPVTELNPAEIIEKMHAHTGNPQIAELNLHPQIRDKTKLVVCDAIMGICDKGPFGPPQFVNNQIIASNDLVALDAVGLSIIDKKAIEMGKPEAKEFAGHLRAAEDFGLGNSDLKNIKLSNFSLG